MKSMIREVYSVVTWIIILTIYSQSLFAAPQSDLIEKMTELREAYHLPSLSIAIGKGNAIVAAEALGFVDVESQTKAQVTTPYSVASLAKPMTGLALAKLAEQGRIDLDAPVGHYLPAFKAYEAFSVKELASHQSGITHENEQRWQLEFSSRHQFTSPLEVMSIFEDLQLAFSPGTGVEYSSNGYILLSGLMEVAAKENFVSLLDSVVWTKLGMTHTAQEQLTPNSDNKVNYYRHYAAEDDYALSPSPRNRSFLFGAGGFVSTPIDMVKLASALYDNDYLQYETKKHLLTPSVLRNGQVNEQHFSLGWQVQREKLSDDNESWLTLSHSGVVAKAATAFIFVVPACEMAISFVTNTVPKQYWRLHTPIKRLLSNSIDVSNCQPEPL